VLALTATATPKVVDDIQERLAFREKRVFSMSFERKNLIYVVRATEDRTGELLHILQSVPTGSAIVYTRTRQQTVDIARFLEEKGITASNYHAGLTNAEKDYRQQNWAKNRVRVMVATNAFGMGIDKPDVRLVIHIDCPDSIEAYFQEAGRAGRDGRKAYAVLLYNDADQRKLEKRIADTFPEKDYIRKVYEHLAYFYQVGVGSGYNHIFEFNIDQFCHTFRHFPIQADAALKILDRAGYIEYTEEQDNQARVMFTIGRDDLYRLENTSPNEEKVITAMLRNYGGLFTDYNFIDESFIAQQTQLEPQQVYLTLKGLSQRHILHFIPQKKTPYIRYTQRREDMEHVQIPPSVYEERKAQFEERIHAMINYAKDDAVCRSRQLLRYFGEESDHDCRQCDVCLSHRSEGLVSEPRMNEAMERILALLDDGQPHPLTELRDLQLPVDELDAALTYLLKEEYIRQSDGLLSRR
jgi:ATP-dependent DNA helicase RecQ